MEGRTCIVVGAGGGGHGTAVCQALLESGALVVAWDASAQALTELSSALDAQPDRLEPMQVDARDASQVGDALGDLCARHGDVHALTNVVGGTRPSQWRGIVDCTDDIFDEVIQTNLRTTFVTCRAVARRMISQGGQGSIVNLSSVSGLVSAPEHGPYGAAKSAVIALSKTMAVEWSAHGIRVNVVAPGAMSVPRLEYLHSQQSAVGQTIPLGKRGTPFDVAAAVLFLHSRLAAYVTGEVLTVDGGLMAKTPYGSAVTRRMAASGSGADPAGAA